MRSLEFPPIDRTHPGSGFRARVLLGAVKAWRLAQAYPLGAFGALFAALLVLMAVVPQWFTVLESQDPLQVHLADRLQGPSATHWFGTDEVGRDLYARIVYGARTSIWIGFGVVVLSQILATALGVASGYYGGWADSIAQRFIDIGIALPWLVTILIALQALSEYTTDTFAVIISVGLLISITSSRPIRGATLSLANEQCVEAARAVGASGMRIMIHHIARNLLPIVIVSSSILVGSAILIESSLSFLGYGVQPPTPSWGRMLADARVNLIRSPHLAFFPGFVIFLTVFSFNMLGDALRDAIDPRLRGSRDVRRSS